MFAGNSSTDLAQEIAGTLGVQLGKISVTQFADGEANIQINDSVRGKDVFVIQSTCKPVNDNLMELLLTISALRNASANRITAVIPYFGYARQDRKCKPRVPISAADVAHFLEISGVDKVLCVDLHSG